MVAALGDHAGPAFANGGLHRDVFFVPPGVGEEWPGLSGAALQWHRSGSTVVVPGRTASPPCPGCAFPLDDAPLVTAPDDLRPVLEKLLGPLETASDLGPVAICAFCGAPSRDVKVTAWGMPMSGAGWCGRWSTWWGCWLSPCSSPGGGPVSADREGTTGLCWRCETDGVPVLWLGPAHSDDYGHAPLHTCEPCVRRIEELIADHVARRYAAT